MDIKAKLNQPIKAGPHYTGMATAVGLGVASGSAGMALLGYAGGQLIHRTISGLGRNGHMNDAAQKARR
jgi:hypothetical protein